jgi:putative inorganic carbon (HCO3(-)) transporter
VKIGSDLVENSVILGLFINIIEGLKKYYRESYIKTIVGRLLKSLEKGREGSLIINYLTSESRLDIRWKESRIYRLASYPFAALTSFLSKRYDAVEGLLTQSGILTVIRAFLSNVFKYSVRSYGMLLFALFASETALWLLFQVNDLRNLAIRAVLLLITFIMLFFNIPVAALFKGSYLYRLIEGAFLDEAAEYDSAKNRKSAGLFFPALAGIGLGIMAYILPAKLAALGIAAVLAVVLILWRYEIGVFMAAGFAAVLSTTQLLLLIGLTLASFALRWLLGKVPKYTATPIDALVVLFSVVLVYSTATSYFVGDSLGVLVVHGLFLAFYFVLTRTVNTRHKLYLLVLFLIISGTLTSLYGVYQYYTGGVAASAWIDQEMFEDIQTRVGSTFNNPNILGEYLIMMIPLAFAALWYRKKPIYNVVFLGMLAVMGIAMIFTFSRGAWLGLMLAVIAFFVVRDKRLLALVLVALMIMPFVLPPSIINRFTSIGNLEDTSSSYRMSILIGSWRMVQDYWISGIGLGSEAFKAIYPKYSLAAAYAHHSHNIYLQIILEMGTAGALLFGLIIIVFARALLVHQKRTGDSFLSTLMIASGAGIAGYLVQGMVENIWYNNRVLFTFWVVMAVGMCALNIGKGEAQTHD